MQLGAEVGQLAAHSVALLPAWHSPGSPPPLPPSVPALVSPPFVAPPFVAPPLPPFVVVLPLVLLLDVVLGPAVAAAVVAPLLAPPALVLLAELPLVEAVVVCAPAPWVAMVAALVPPALDVPLSASAGAPQLDSMSSRPVPELRVRGRRCGRTLGAIM